MLKTAEVMCSPCAGINPKQQLRRSPTKAEVTEMILLVKKNTKQNQYPEDAE